MGTADASSSEIHPLSDLEEVFLYFFDKFQTLPSPRSVVEARITVEERDDLARWLCGNWHAARDWFDSTWQDDLRIGTSASRQEMLGSLLLILASEVCRNKSNEDAVWPAVTEVFKGDKGALAALFPGGQPSTACKKAIAAGARKLNLRNLIDRYGQQEYFDTVKLQFGFTFNGAVHRLPEWLDKLGVPIAVKILSGDEPEYADLKSDSFTQAWKALLDFRRSRVSEEYAAAILHASAWIRPQWVSELMQAARLRLTRNFTALVTMEGPDRPSESVYEPMLRWESQAKPQLILRLNDELVSQILSDSDKAVFAVDGRVVDRWTAQEGGGWRGKRELPCQPEGLSPNLRPKVLSISSDGNLREEIDLFTIMGEPLLIFDLKSGTAVDPAERLDRGRDYGFICDPDFAIPTASQFLKLGDRLVYRTSSPWQDDLKVVNDGILYWQARVDEKEPIPAIRITLESPTEEASEIGSLSPIRMSGVPVDVAAVSLIGGNSTHPATKQGVFWQTKDAVRLTLGIAMGHERLRIRVTGAGYTRTVIPKLSLNLRGLACIEADSDSDGMPQWILLNRQRPLNRTNGSGKARVFVGTSRSQLYEGPCLVGKITSRALPLRDIFGWGSPLVVRSETEPDFVLVDSVLDYGNARFQKPLFKGRTPTRVLWRTPMPLSNEHRVLVWSNVLHDPRELGANSISSEKDGLVWNLPDVGSLAAMAIAYKGVRIASDWVTESIIGALRRSPSSRLFNLCRWLKLPVLNQSFRAPMEEAIALDPAEFVSGWAGSKALGSGLVHREAEQGVDSVIREFLWNYSRRSEAMIDRVARAFPRPLEGVSHENESMAFKLSLVRLGELCPSLAYNFASHKVRGHRYLTLVRAVAASMLRLPENTDLQLLKSQLIVARRDCANLIGISSETLEVSAQGFEAQLHHRTFNHDYKQFESELRRLGETLRGRQFLTALLLIRFIERSRF